MRNFIINQLLTILGSLTVVAVVMALIMGIGYCVSMICPVFSAGESTIIFCLTAILFIVGYLAIPKINK